MRLLRLELQGFKSFLDRTILTFEAGITGVVGPNGCGKSNIVDAIMWVMGEQSPKHLRGDAMTDVIFNGSDSRAATSMAEVSLVMERTGVVLSPQFSAFDKADEISVTRRIYRDGIGEFLINKVPCRLKDIHELFMDTGVGRRAYSIIEQGQIDRMINVKAEDRRYLFEEVAGITKYKAKRKEAERKLELTRLNILRLQDIITELEKQIRSLKIQATKARKYKEIKSELEVVDLFLLGQSLSTHERLIHELQAKRDELINLRSESDALFSQVDVQVTELDILRIDQEKAYQELGEKERDITLRIQKLENQLNIFEERKKFIVQSNEEIVAEETEIRDREEQLAVESEAQETEKFEVEHRLRQMDMEVSEKDQSLRQAQESKQRLGQKKISVQNQLVQLGSREIHLNTQRQNGHAKQQDIQEACLVLTAKLSEIVTTLEGHRDVLRQTEERISACSTRGLQAEQEAAQIHSECQQTSSRLSEVEDNLFKMRETFSLKNSRLETLSDLQKNLEGYSPTAKEILLSLESGATGAVPLAEVLQPDRQFEEHLEILLGADMNTLLVGTSGEAESLARLIEERGLERVRIAPLSDMAQETSPSPIEGATPALERIKVREGFEAAAKRWLGRVYLTGSRDQILSLRNQHPGATFFALDSKIIAHGDGSLTSGAVQSKMGVFARRREIDELTSVCAELSQELGTLTTERESLLHQLEEQEARHAELKDTLSQIHVESVELRKEREKIVSELNRAERDHQSIQSDSQRAVTQLEAVEQQLQAWEEESTKVALDKDQASLEIAGLETEIHTASETFDEIMVAINESKIERSRLGERMNSLQYKFEKITAEIAQLQSRAESIRNQRMNDEKELVRLEAEGSEIAAEKEAATVERNASLVQIADLKAAFNETCTTLTQLREQKDDLQERRGQVLEQTQETELKIAQEQSQLEQVRSISNERYHSTPNALPEDARLQLEQLPLLAGQLDVTWELLLQHEQESLLKEHVKNLREKIDRYGEVNLTAISEFDEVQKRFDFLMLQKTDLENSIKILEEAIQKIDESTKTRFEETFNAVNGKFREIFPILFNGGKAELSLTNPDNMLEAGVDVMVQPPGKRLQSITLLSGGEKALTAVSLILAIFARKPSPFCLLDEVDAPLDDANVSRFNTVIRKMAEKTQFIVITHNKKTMEIAESLYGVTMERAGVSKMTSVRLN